MTENSIIVTLSDDYEITPFEDSLKKGIGDCKKKTFKEILDYMLIPKEDENNPEYNEREKVLCERISNQINNPEPTSQIDLRYYDSKDNLYRADLSKKVCEYENVIRNETDIRNGEEIKYQGIKLEAFFDALGGFE